MEQNFCLVSFGKRGKACGLIIGILLQEWPLSAAALHKRLMKRCAYPISYQGTHKIVKKMLQEGILERDGKHYYKISLGWAGKLQRFGAETRKAHLAGKGKLEFPA
jgi:hypothetical protein